MQRRLFLLLYRRIQERQTKNEKQKIKIKKGIIKIKKTGTIKTKVFAGVIAAVCAVSAISTGAIVGASAHSSASTTVI